MNLLRALSIVLMFSALTSCDPGNPANPNPAHTDPNPKYSDQDTTYTVTYDGNGNTGGSAPIDPTAYLQGQLVTVYADTTDLVRTGYAFSGWNTSADGSGTTYSQAEMFTMGTATVTLYAQWKAVIVGYAYAANTSAGSISQYIIGGDGVLRSMTTATLAAERNLDAITADPSGKYVYVANQNKNVSQYKVGEDGSLTLLAAPVLAGLGPTAITVDPAGKYVYVANQGDDTVSQYTIGADGALTPMTPPTAVAGSWPQSVAVHPSGRYAYVANLMNSVSQYALGTDGALTPMNPQIVPAGNGACSVTIDPSGRYAYVANDNGWDISQYTIGETGALTPMTTPTAGIGWASIPFFVAVDPTGKYVYSVNAGFNTLSQFTIGVDGALTSTAQTVSTGNMPASMTFDTSGRFAYVTNSVGNTISEYMIGVNGQLTPIATTKVMQGTGPQSLVTVPATSHYGEVIEDQLIPEPPREGKPDLIIVDIYKKEEMPYYVYVKYENIGTGGSDEDFLIKISTTKGEFPGNSFYRFLVPEPGETIETGGFSVGLIGMTEIETAQVTAEIDWEGRVDELNEDNNTLTKTVGP